MPTSPPASPQDERLQTALAALQRSRAALRQELLGDDESRPDRGTAASACANNDPMVGTDSGRWWRRLRRMARRSPWLGLATGSLRDWWRQQPWHDSSRQLSRELLAQGRPLVQQHPVAAVAMAAACGAALVVCRPWRWPWLQGPLRAAPAQAGQWLLAQLASAPVQAALLGLLMNSLRSPAARDQDAAGANTRSP